MAGSEPADLVRLATERTEAGTVVHVTGEVDMFTAPTLESYLRARLDEHPASSLVLNLSGVTFFGSAGLNVLLALHHECLRRRVGLRLAACSAAVLRPLELTGLWSYFDRDEEVG